MSGKDTALRGTISWFGRFILTWIFNLERHMFGVTSEFLQKRNSLKLYSSPLSIGETYGNFSCKCNHYAIDLNITRIRKDFCCIGITSL